MNCIVIATIQCPDCDLPLRRRTNGDLFCDRPTCKNYQVDYAPFRVTLERATGVVSAAGAAEEETTGVVQASFNIHLPMLRAGEPMPADIQYLPPGRHVIRASRDGKPWKGPVVGDEGAAQVLQTFLEERLALSAKHEGDAPYLDLNHDDREASAWPKEFFWAGDDPVTGGVRCKLEWSSAGEAAIRGKTYRRFSPNIIPDAEGQIVGTSVNMGGLVNRAAFTKIAAIWSKENPSDDPNPNQPNKDRPTTMKKLLSLLKKHGLIPDADIDETDAVTHVSAKLTEIDGRLGRIEPLETEVKDLKKEIVTTKETHAKSVVASLVKCGAIPPKDEALQKRYVDLLVADPANEAILPKAQNPALGKAVVSAKGANDADLDLPGGETPGDKLIVSAKGLMKENGDLHVSDAVVQACADDDEEYRRYRVSLGLGSKEERKKFGAALAS